MKKKLFSMLALLCLTAVSAWADPQEELLVTITATGQDSYSQSPDGFATVTLNNIVFYYDGYGWLNGGSVTVEAPAGYTITRCVFKQVSEELVDDQAPFTATISESDGLTVTTSTGDVTTEQMNGITSIEVYGYQNETDPVVTPTANANEWTFTMPESDVELQPEYYTDLKEDEAIDYTALEASPADIWLCRTLKTGGWNTFASPVAIDATGITALGITAVKELSSSSFSEGKLTLNFDNATTIEAGKPYLVMVSADKEIGAFDGATVSGSATPTETDAVDFIPTLGKTLVTGPAGDVSNTKAVLFLTNHEGTSYLIYPSVVNDNTQDASYLKGFRAYFQLKGEAQDVKSYTINFGDGETTSIHSMDNGQLTMDNVVYDLQGRRVNSTAHKGVFIVNGKKVIK